jgi:hypothetical protein
MKHVIVMGTIGDGFQIIGPFEDPEQAVEWASENDGGLPWEIVELEKPE